MFYITQNTMFYVLSGKQLTAYVLTYKGNYKSISNTFSSDVDIRQCTDQMFKLYIFLY